MRSNKQVANDWVDISIPLSNGMVGWPGDPPVRIERIENIETGDVSTLSFLSFGSHSGTHVDAQSHFLKAGQTVDNIPLVSLIGAASVIEIADPESIKPAELRLHRIRRGQRILIKTRNSRLWRDAKKQFTKKFVHLTVEAAIYLVERGISVIGVDYLSVGGINEDGNEVHRILLGASIHIIEGLDLSVVKTGSYDLVCMPLRIQNGDGAPARAVLRRRRV